jgi:hypothetical protein
MFVLKLKMSFPKSALQSEFGWEPINEFLDRQRVNCFARFGNSERKET